MADKKTVVESMGNGQDRYLFPFATLVRQGEITNGEARAILAQYYSKQTSNYHGPDAREKQDEVVGLIKTLLTGKEFSLKSLELTLPQIQQAPEKIQARPSLASSVIVKETPYGPDTVGGHVQNSRQLDNMPYTKIAKEIKETWGYQYSVKELKDFMKTVTKASRSAAAE